ncbi:MAG: hypothetical protein QM710_09815 [Flavobacterium sp.]
MKSIFSALLVLLFLSSCQEDPKVRALQQQKEDQKREVIFNNISKGWNFNWQSSNEASRNFSGSWAEWRIFLNEMGQKPKSSIGAFQQKAKTLSKRATELNNNIPIKYNLPEIRSRIAVITTKVNAINLYIHLNQIQDKKVVQLVQEINTELTSLDNQLDEIKRRGEIRMEDGEEDMIRMLDTARAIPTNPNPKNIK